MVEYIFFYKNIVVGGCELLIEKISKWIVEMHTSQEANVKILCRTIDETMQERFDGSGVEVYPLADWDDEQEICRYISTGNEIRMITFFWEDFVRVYRLKNKKMKTVLYAVHFQVLAVGETCRFRLLKWLLKSIGAKVIYELLCAGKILCMDEQTVRHTQNYFNTSFLKNASIYKIIRIPINILPVEEKQLVERAQNERFNVLAIARAEFPFKGYLLGLIDFIAGQVDKRNLHLDIISYGPDIDKLKDKIDSLDEETKKLITLHGKTDYDTLGQFYDEAKLYIGMGTTILDAAQRGVISVPVAPYTEEVIVNTFFHEDYRVLAVDSDMFNNIFEIWKAVRKLECAEYLELSKKTRKVTIENYSVERTVERIIANFEIINDDRWNRRVCIFKFMGKGQSFLNKIRRQVKG